MKPPSALRASEPEITSVTNVMVSGFIIWITIIFQDPWRLDTKHCVL